MLYTIALLSVVFIALAVVLMSRMATVMKGIGGSASPTGEAQYDRSNQVNGWLMIIFWVVGVIAGVWSFMVALPHFLPEASSPHGRRTDQLFWVAMTIVTLAFFLTNTMLFYFAFKYRGNTRNKASYYPENHKLELIWTVVPAIIMALMVFTGWRAWRDIMSEAPQGAQEFELVGKQFNWIARYPGVDNNKLGSHNYKLIDNNNDTGIDFADENSFDDFTSTTELHIPVNKPILLRIRARDVLHSVFIPHMRVKMDAVPGMPTRFWFVADKTTDEMKNITNNQNFTYEIACTEVCGRGHFGMRLRLIVEDETTWKAWCAQQKPLLTSFPEYASRIPDNLKTKAARYLPAQTDSTTASAEQGGALGTSSSLR